MLYFDNAATTYPKPNSVINAVNNSMIRLSANPGRAGHYMAQKTSELVYLTREKAAVMFGVESPENVIFTQNCTYALNCVIKGLAKKGSHFIISSLEHNAVARPLETLKNRGICTYSIAKVEKDDESTVENFKRLIRRNTVAIICTGASNVFGKMPPIRQLAQLAHSHSLLFAVDAAQTAGIMDINCQRDGIDFLCVAAHKGLYAPMGLGLLIINCDTLLETVSEGGTGTNSFLLTQPETNPERYESGTLSIPLIAGLSAGIDYINRQGIHTIYRHEKELITYLYQELKYMKNIELYTDMFSEYENFAPLLSFNVKGKPSEETASRLNNVGIAVRAGFHCAPLAHNSYNTAEFGTVRVAPSYFTKKNDVNLLLNSVFQIAKT